MILPEIKLCSKCKQEKSASAFHKCSKSADKLQSKCIECAHLAYLANNEKRLAYKKEYYAQNRDKILATEQKRYKEQSERLKQKARDFRKNNPDKHNASNAATRAAKLQAIPQWLDKEDKWMIQEAYSLAQLRTRLFGFEWHVDHIVPLRGKTVCGLHVPWNLQVIPAADNLSKSNQFVE
jgi:hypothetical protein